MMRPIFLIGYMCSGKSTLGRAVERATGLPFIDLDELVESRAGMTVSEIFAARGEDGFRRLEREALKVAAETPGGALIACGGGTPCQPGNMELMRSCGLTVHLQASHPRLLNRLRLGRAKRPIIARLSDDELEAFVIDQLERRRPWYEQAAETFDSSLLENDEEIAMTVKEFSRRFL